MTSQGAFRRARFFAILGLVAVPVSLIGSMIATVLPVGGETINAIGAITLSISFLTLLVTVIATSSSILLGWRADRRQSVEYKLKIEQLELQLVEARKKAIEPAQNSN
jgi:hypothetical protein